MSVPPHPPPPRKLSRCVSAATTIENARVLQRQMIEEFKYFLADSIDTVITENECRPVGREISMGPSVVTGLNDLEQDLADFEAIETAFVVSSAGDMRVNGEWRCLGPGRFVRIVDGETRMQWDEQSKHWQLLYGEELLYQLPSEGSIPIVEEGWLAVQGKEPVPSLATSDSMQHDRHIFYEIFVGAWQQVPPFCSDEGPIHWTDLRGPYGESILSWLWILRSSNKLLPRVQCFYRSLTVWLLHFHPSLAGVRMIHEPFVGQTILHQACAASDVELVDFMVTSDKLLNQPFFRSGFLESRLTGSFGRQTNSVPERLEGLVDACTPRHPDPEMNGFTPLEVACSAAKDDDKCAAIIRLLLKAGAMPIYFDESDMVRYNLLHAIARSGWSHDMGEAPVLSPARTKLLLQIFLDPKSLVCKKWGMEMRSQANGNGYTPLQVAAMFGNEASFCEILDYFKVDVWEWGTKKQVGFPLGELDSGASDDQICALELMTLQVHYNLLSLSIIAEVIQQKWELFGQLWILRHLAVQMICWTCTAIVCLDDTAGYSRLRHGARLLVLLLSSGYILLFFVVLALCAADEEWFQNMDWRLFQRSRARVKFWSLLTVRSGIELFLMALLVLVPPWYANGGFRAHPFYNFYWHVCASCFFMSGFAFALRYLELFHQTSALALAIPEVAKRDMLPFFVLFTVILLSCAVSLRIACELDETGGGDRSTFGSFIGVLKTLEEAIHGPDVQWRNAVEQRPALAGTIFILFLWLALIMVSLLIAMFSSTFDVLKVTTSQQLMYRRATFCITCEKLFPQWYYTHWRWGHRGCKIGAKLGLRQAGAGSLTTPHTAITATSIQHFKSYGTWESYDPENAEGIDQDRWVLWIGNDERLDEWRKPYAPARIQ